MKRKLTAVALLLSVGLCPHVFGQVNKPTVAPKLRMTADKQELPEAQPRDDD